MILIEVNELNTVLIKQLFEVWDKSVRETHLFLSDSEIKNISRYIPQALSSIDHLIVAFNDENKPIAFMGIEERKLEMLFVSPQFRGKGLGKQLIQYGIENYSINELGVNEQNPQAKKFYEHMGFQVYKRTDTDEQGNPYPILYMRLV
ncbi:MAG: GNAT family N-acetyltransferase [Hungatella sp.]|nr:GNAT family N-acetyltransferase [Hungatella sp.]